MTVPAQECLFGHVISRCKGMLKHYVELVIQGAGN